MGTNDSMLTGLFRDRDSAERAYQSISDRGYSREDVNVVMSDETRKRHFSGSPAGRETELGTKAAEGAGIGGAIGGSLGAIAAAIAAVGTTIALPGLGLVIAGPLAAAIAGAGAGAATGGIVSIRQAEAPSAIGSIDPVACMTPAPASSRAWPRA